MSVFFPMTRMRRLRKEKWIRDIVSETTLDTHNLILPLFVQEGENKTTKIPSMPGVCRHSIDMLLPQIRKCYDLGIKAVALFPYVTNHSNNAEESYNSNNLVCRAIMAIKKEVPSIGVIADIALDPYTHDGHDGILNKELTDVDNDATLNILCKQSLAMAEAGCDIIAPSDMMDGRIAKIRETLEDKGFKDTIILSYAAKYASSLYGPFRDAVGRTANTNVIDKRSYQMDYANSDEAVREVLLDINEGADIVMVKPASLYLDVIAKVKQSCDIPIFAYQVSGEYSMIKLASKAERPEYYNALMLESLTSIKRAGARSILTYAAIDMAELIRKTR